MLNITRHRGNANQNHKTLCHTQQDGSNRKDRSDKGLRMWRNWNPPTLLMEMQNGSVTLENSSWNIYSYHRSKQFHS